MRNRSYATDPGTLRAIPAVNATRVKRNKDPRTRQPKSPVFIIKAENPVSKLRPFSDYLTAYLRGLVSKSELDLVAGMYGELGYKVKTR